MAGMASGLVLDWESNRASVAAGLHNPACRVQDPQGAAPNHLLLATA